MKNILTLFLIISSQFVLSQNDFFDFIINHNNDTIYGTYRGKKLIDLNKKTHRINTKKIKTIRFKDRTYYLTLLNSKDFFSDENDSIIGIQENNGISFNKEGYFYASKLNEKERKEYIVLKGNDKIYGRIKKNRLGSEKLISDSNEEYSLNSNSIISYQKNGSIYFHKENLRNTGYINSDKRLVKLLYNGSKVKLFEQETKNSINYYIERNGNLEYILPERFYKMISRIMPENKELIKKIRKRVYTYNDIYLVVKYFNEVK
jgi:hypothetical protein